MSDFPRSPEHQEARNALARNVVAHRKERDALRKEAQSFAGRVKKVLGIKDSETLADKQQALATQVLADGKRILEPLERRHRMSAFEHDHTNVENSMGVKRQKGDRETRYELDSLRELYEDILATWKRNKKDYPQLPQELSERFSLVSKRRFLRDAETSPEVVFELLSNYGCLRLNCWTVNYKKRKILLTLDIYTRGEDGTTKGKGQAALQNTSSLLQEFSNQSDFTVYEAIVPNAKSTPLFLQDSAVQSLVENPNTFADHFFRDDEEGRKEAFVHELGHWETLIKIYRPGESSPIVPAEDVRAVAEIMRMI